MRWLRPPQPLQSHRFTLSRVLEQDEVARELGHGGDSLIKRVYGHLGTVRHRAEMVEFRIEQHRDRDGIRDRLRGLRVA